MADAEQALERGIGPQSEDGTFSRSGHRKENIHAMVEHRQHPRYPVEGYAEVFLPHGGLLLRGRILNVSLSGCYIETTLLNLERGTRVEVYFVANQLQFRVAGTIAVNRRKLGAGIAFLNVSSRQERQITELVRELSEKA